MIKHYWHKFLCLILGHKWHDMTGWTENGYYVGGYCTRCREQYGDGLQ